MRLKNIMDAKSYTDKELTTYFRRIIKHDNWFIAGSFANTKVERPSDIDIFFFTKEDFEAAQSRYANYVKPNTPVPMFGTGMSSIKDIENTFHTTHNSASIFDEKLNIRVQLICRHFGSVDRIFDTFDLNVAKKAIQSNGSRIYHPDSDKPISICNINSQTFRRVVKYAYYFGDKRDITAIGKILIDRYIGDSTVITEYYDENELTTTVNKSLFDVLENYDSIKPYLIEQTAIYAPELVL